MEWFQGGVAAAITACRQQQALFVVYIADSSEESSVTNASWSSAEVLGTLSGQKCVGLKIVKDSMEHQQFSLLYPVFVFPSVFCIGVTGQALVAMNGRQSSEQLAEKLGRAFGLLETELSGGGSGGASGGGAPDTPTVSGEGVVAPSGEVVGLVSTTAEAAGGTVGEEDREDTLDEKVERYQNKIRQRRNEKAAEEQEREKQLETERRQVGRDVGRLRQKQEEQRNQSWIQERKKQKEEEQRVRDELRAKLRQDRLEREAQTSGSPVQGSTSGSASQRSAEAPSSAASGSSACRVQLRLPSGRTRVLSMKREDTLAALREAAAQELGEPVLEVSLTAVYPRQELTKDLDSHSLADLQLAPSGVVIVRTGRDQPSLRPSSSGTGQSVLVLLQGLFQLIVFCFTWLKDAIVGLFSGGSLPAKENGGPLGSSAQQPSTKRYNSSGSGQSQRVRRFRQEDFEDEDDEENKSTYNGNSTQQQ